MTRRFMLACFMLVCVLAAQTFAAGNAKIFFVNLSIQQVDFVLSGVAAKNLAPVPPPPFGVQTLQPGAASTFLTVPAPASFILNTRDKTGVWRPNRSVTGQNIRYALNPELIYLVLLGRDGRLSFLNLQQPAQAGPKIAFINDGTSLLHAEIGSAFSQGSVVIQNDLGVGSVSNFGLLLPEGPYGLFWTYAVMPQGIRAWQLTDNNGTPLYTSFTGQTYWLALIRQDDKNSVRGPARLVQLDGPAPTPSPSAIPERTRTPVLPAPTAVPRSVPTAPPGTGGNANAPATPTPPLVPEP